MKRTVKVTIEKEFEIDIPDHMLTDTEIALFEGSMWKIEDTDKKDGLFKHVARMAALDDGEGHAEGVGYFGSEYMRKYSKNPVDYTVVTETDDYCEMEIVE